MLEARLNVNCSAYAPLLQAQPPDSHFGRALHWFPESRISRAKFSTFAGVVQAPLRPETRTVMAGLFEMLWASSLAKASKSDSEQYHGLCSPDSPEFILDEPDYCAFFTYSMFSGAVKETS
jgi:hypothetical protein